VDTLLVIEDSPPMQRAIQRVFEAEAFTVHLASDGLAGLESFRGHIPSAVVLDLKLPGIPGRELCREFKTIAPSVPVIVVSANAEVDDKVLLLELGADDYVTKPFSPKELVARVRRAMRRAVQMSRSTTQVLQSESHLYCFADVTVNADSMEVRRSGKRVSLTAQEFRVLRYFIDRANRAISREELLNEVWGYQNYPSTRTVDNHILRLRQKLEADPSNPQHFLTLHRAGYKFMPVIGQEQASG
jgi:DNA-binding response OmpR family regulator